MTITKKDAQSRINGIINTLLVADQYDYFRKSLAAFLLENRVAGAVRQAASGEEALDKFIASFPDLVVMDIDMTHLDGIALTRQMKAIRPEVPVVLYSLAPEDQFGARPLPSDAFIPKDDLFDKLIPVLSSLRFPS